MEESPISTFLRVQYSLFRLLLLLVQFQLHLRLLCDVIPLMIEFVDLNEVFVALEQDDLLTNRLYSSTSYCSKPCLCSLRISRLHKCTAYSASSGSPECDGQK